MRGFTILEVMIATAIASAISVVLFVALRQTMGYQERVDTLVDTYTRATLIQNQLERDFMGFFVPHEAYELVSTKTGEKTSGREQAEQIDKIFYATKSKDQFGLLSFITTNAMQVYWGKTMGAPKPLVARVVYRLMKDKLHEDSFTLTRQESRNLDFAPFEGAAEKQKVRAYEIVGDVKSMKVTYLARVYRNKDQKNPSTQASPKATPGKAGDAPAAQASKSLPSWTYKEFSEWDWSPKKAKQKDTKSGDKKPDAKKEPEKKEQISRVPMYIQLTIELWNLEHTRSTPFEFVFVRKPFEMAELEKDTPPEAEKPAPQMPNLKPMLDMLKLPSGPPKPTLQPRVQSQPRRIEGQAREIQGLPKIAGLQPNFRPGVPTMPIGMPGMRMPVMHTRNPAVAQAHSTGSGRANQGVR